MIFVLGGNGKRGGRSQREWEKIYQESNCNSLYLFIPLLRTNPQPPTIQEVHRVLLAEPVSHIDEDVIEMKMRVVTKMLL